MSILSLDFAALCIVTTLAVFLCPPRRRLNVLLIAGAVFLATQTPLSILCLLFSVAMTYGVALRIAAAILPGPRRVWLTLGILCNLGLLIVMKYLDFFVEGLLLIIPISPFTPRSFSEVGYPPLGLSFYTLVAAGYLIDVYRNPDSTEKHPMRFALFLSFFPSFVAGPIQRSTDLLQQLRSPPSYSPHRIVRGVRTIAFGLLQKLVIADRLAHVVESIYGNAASSGFALLFATYLFAIQIYYDFAGYTAIAVGIGRVLGFDLTENFRQPYAATSVADFWRRWHISLSSWFRDYLYIPLGGNRGGRARQCLNVLIVFAASGLWHGASATFLVWGLIHGIAIAGGIFTMNLRAYFYDIFRVNRYPQIHTLFQKIVTFHIILFSWIFFRADSLDHAASILRSIGSDLASLFSGAIIVPQAINMLTPSLFFSPTRYALVLLALLAAVLIGRARVSDAWRVWFMRQHAALRWAWYGFVLLMILMIGTFNTNVFIYSRF